MQLLINYFIVNKNDYIKMLDAYKRNGELFLASIKQEDKNKNRSIDDLIKENFRKPVLELVGHTRIGENASELDILKALKNYFEVSSSSREILNASFFKTGKGTCSLCGKTTDVFSNRSYIFPFERKIDSIAPEDMRLQFCKECGFTLYCGMAYLYANAKGTIKFFFDSYNQKNLWKINNIFKNLDLQDPNNYNKIKSFGVFTYHPYETLFVIIFEFVNRLKEKNLINEVKDIDDVKLLLAVGSGQIYETHIIEGDKLNKFVEFFSKMIDDSKELYKKIDKEKVHIDGNHLIFRGFFDNLTVGQTTEEKSRLRNLFVKDLLDKKINFIILNEIIMERVKNKEKSPVPFHYYAFLNLYMNTFKMETEQQMFNRINGLGFEIGNKIKGTNLDNFIWEIFRARGIEEFYNVLVELQAKLEMKMDLRPINEYEKEWRKAKAVLLNGILNALYQKEQSNIKNNMI